jgi:hypothetical protein
MKVAAFDRATVQTGKASKAHDMAHMTFEHRPLLFSRRVVAALPLLFAMSWADGASGDAAPAVARTVLRFDVARDGSDTADLHEELPVTSAAVARSLARKVLVYDPVLRPTTIVAAYTLKPDGTKLPVDVTKAERKTLAPTVTSLGFVGGEELSITFPDVAPGDVVVSDVHVAERPAIPGYYTAGIVLPPIGPAIDFTETFTAPMPLHVETEAGMTLQTHRDGGRNVYTVRYAAPANFSSAATPGTARYDWWPRAFVSSAGSYGELGDAYGRFVEPRTVPDPAVRAQADAITAGIADRREQARAIYDWVSRRIDYRAIELGATAVIPNAPAATLAARAGDCKDKATLLLALLRAKGIAGNLVLLNSGTAYSIPTVASFNIFTHAIAWLPEFGVYADTTSGVLPFGELSALAYGKPVLHVAAHGSAIHRIAPLAAAQASVQVEEHVSIDAQGRVTSDDRTTASGPLAVTFRHYAQDIARAGPRKFAAYYLIRTDLPSPHGTLSAPDTTALTPDYTLSGHYETAPLAGALSGAAFAPPAGLRLTSPFDANLVSRVVDGSAYGDPVLCQSARYDETYRLDLPAGYHLAQVPGGLTLKTQAISYRSRWSVQNGRATVTRAFEADFGPTCSGAVRTEAAAALAQIRRDFETKISLVEQQ